MAGGKVKWKGPEGTTLVHKVPGSKTEHTFVGGKWITISDESDYKWYVWYALRNVEDWEAKVRLAEAEVKDDFDTIASKRPPQKDQLWAYQERLRKQYEEVREVRRQQFGQNLTPALKKKLGITLTDEDKKHLGGDI